MELKTFTMTTSRTLRDWLFEEIEQRHLSVREFAKKAKVGHTTLNRILDPKKEDDTFPSVQTLIRLSEFTGTDLCSLVAMVAPDRTRTDAQATILAQRIMRLSEAKRQFLESYFLGEALKGSD